MERPSAPPEAVLIRLAREAADLRMADAARKAGVSVARWAQIEAGSEMRSGTVSPVTGKAGTIARMAHAVGVSAGRLAIEGQRPDAAEIVREIARQQADSRVTALPSRPADDGPPVTAQLEADMARHLAAIRAAIVDAVDRNPGRPLTGKLIFPRDPKSAETWDLLVKIGWGLDGTAKLLAIMIDDAEKKAAGQGSTAAGLNLASSAAASRGA